MNVDPVQVMFPKHTKYPQMVKKKHTICLKGDNKGKLRGLFSSLGEGFLSI